MKTTTTTVSLRTNRKNRTSGVNRKSGLRSILAASIGALLGVTAASNAATFTYDDGGATINWSDAVNWNPNGAPTVTGAPGHDLVFSVHTAGAGVRTAGNDLLTNVNSITFGGQTFLLNGNALTLAAGGIANNSANLQTLSFGGTGITVGASQLWNAAAGALSVTSAVNLNGAVLTITGAQNSALSGSVSGAGTLTKTGAGTLTISGANSFTGVFNANAGTVNVSGGTNSAISGSALNIGTNGGAVGSAIFNTAGNNVANTAAVTIGNAGVFNASGFETVGNISSNAGVSTAVINLSGANGGVSVADNTSQTYNGAINGAGGALGAIQKAGTGTWTLGGASNFTGVTFVQAGVLNIQNSLALGTADGTVANGTDVSTGATLQLGNGVVVGNEALIIRGAGFNPGTGALGALAVAAGGAATFGGPINALTSATISAAGGTLTLTGGITKTGVNLTLGSTNATNAGGTINVNTTGISGNSGAYNSDLIVDSVTTNLNAANSYVGNTFIRTTAAAGTLNANVLNALPNSTDPNINLRTAVTMNDGVPTAAATLNIANGIGQAVQLLTTTNADNVNPNATINLSAGSTLTMGNHPANPLGQGNSTGVGFGGVIAGAGALTKDGTNSQILTGTNTYTGFTTVTSGVLQVGNGITLNSKLGPSVVFVNGGNLDINLANNESFANTVFTVLTTSVRGIGANINTIAGPVLGTGGLDQNGTGRTILTNTNLYTGPTNVNAGTLQVGNDIGGSIAAASVVTVAAAGTLDIKLATNTTFGNNVANAGIINGTAAGVNTVSGVISGAGVLNQNGAGTTIITGANTYTGATTVIAGTLQIGDGLTAGTTIALSGTVNVRPNATLAINLANNGIFSNNVTSPLAGFALVETKAAGTNTLSGVLSNGVGVLSLTQSGTGTTILTGNNTYSGTTTISGGTLQVGNGGASGTAGVGNGQITNNATLTYVRSDAYSETNLISGTGIVNQNGASSLTLTRANTYSGVTNVNTGTLILGDATALGSAVGGTNVANGATLDLNGQAVVVERLNSIQGTGVGGFALTNGAVGAASFTGDVNLTGATTIGGNAGNMTLAGSIGGGAQALTKAGTNTVILTGASTYTGATTVAFGTLQVDGSLANTAVTVNNGATLAGKGTIVGGVSILNGGNLNPGTSPGTITVGSLVLVNGSNSNFELAGPGVIGSGVNDLVNVTGNLTLDGNINVTPLAGPPAFGSGSYRLFNYGGVLTITGLPTAGGAAGNQVTGVPAGFSPMVITSVAGQVNLLVLPIGPGPLQFWDGNAGPANDGIIQGGNGNWNNFTFNWTNNVGNPNASWQNGTAMFGGTAGQVTITEPVSAQSLVFTQTGYVITASGGNALNLVDLTPATPTINVVGGIATINAQITGNQGFTANGTGTLILGNAANSFTGGITVTNGGAVSIGADGALGGAASGVTLNNGTLQTTATFTLGAARVITLGVNGGTLDVVGPDTLTLGVANQLTGVGNLTKIGTGVLNLTAANNYTGNTAINGGTLQVNSDNTLGVGGNLSFANNAILKTTAAIVSARAITLNAGGGTVDTNSFNSTLTGVIGDLGGGNQFTKTGLGTLTLTATETYTGGTNINGGTLQIGDGVTALSNLAAASLVTVNSTGTLAVNLLNGEALATTNITNNAGGTVTGINAAGTQTVGAVITGAGNLNQNGLGTTILTGASTYTGTTTVIQGTLQIGDGVTAGTSIANSVTTTVNAGATLALNLANNGIFTNSVTNDGTINAINNTPGNIQTATGNIIGSGVLNQNGAGITVLTGVNLYAGLTTVNAGVLVVGNASALGSIGAGTVVNNGGSLMIASGILTTAEPLTINGNGAPAVANFMLTPGALTQSLNGSSTFNGPITVGSTNTSISTNGTGTLTLTGGINKNNVVLTLRGGGTININGIGISGATSFTSDLVVDGTGVGGATIVNANVANSYAGPTWITNGGTFNANVLGALPSPAADGGIAAIRTTVIMDPVAPIPGSIAPAPSTGGSVLNIGGSAGFPLGASQAIQSLTGTDPTSLVKLGSNTLTIGTALGGTTTFAGVISSATSTVAVPLASIIKDGTSVQIFGGAGSTGNTYTGSTTVSNGTLQAGVATTAFGVNSATTVGTGATAATLALNGFSNTIGTLTGNTVGVVQNGAAAGLNSILTLGSGVILPALPALPPTTTFAGVVQDGGASTLGITKTGAGTQIFSGPNTYTGPTTVNAGTLKAGVVTVIPFGPVGTVPNSGAFGINSAVTMANTAGAVLDITGFNTQIGSITGGGAAGGNVTLGAATLTTGGDNSSPAAAYAGTISGTGQFRKIGTGTQILGPTAPGGNTYTGLTTIFRGTLSLSGGNAIVNPSLVTPTAGAVQIAPVTAGHNGTLNLASSETIGSLSDATIGPVAGAVAGSTTTVALNTNILTLGVASINPLGATTFGGTITSTGAGNALKKDGADAFTLSGNTSTYTGGTTLNGGRLNINNSSLGALVSGPVGTGTLTINASNAVPPTAGGNTIGTTTTSGAGASNTIANAVALNASFNVAGTAVVPLPVGGVQPASGVDGVTFSGAVSLNAANVTVNTQGGFLDFTGTIGQNVAGNGLTFTGNTFTLIGAGTALDAPNTYTGLTKVSSGYVLLNKGGAGVAIPGNLQVDAGALVQTTGVAANQIAATSSAVVNGTLDLAGANQTLANLTGAGTVRLDNSVFNAGPATAAAVFSVDSGNFTGSIVDSGPGAGSGSVVKNTAGTLALFGASTYTGGTTMNAGALQAGNGKAFGSGNLTLNGGLIQTIGGPLVVDIGGGNVQFNGGIYQAIVGGTLPGVNHDQLKTTGTFAAPGGTLALVQQNGYLLAPGDKVNLAVATGGVAGGSVNGTAIPNASITGLDVFSVTPLLVPTVNLYPTTVTLEAMQGLFAGINGQTFQGFKVNFTPNQFAVARALDSVSARNLFKTGVVRELNFLDTQPIATLPGNLDKIAPEELTSVFHLAVSLANVNTHNLERRMEDIRMGGNVGFSAPTGGGTRFSGEGKGMVSRRSKEITPPSDDHWGMFLTGTGEFTRIGSNFNAVGYNLTTGGITAGLDYKVNANFAVGLSLGYANTTADLANGGSLDVDGGRLGLYATYYDQNFHVDATVSGGLNSYKTRRVTPNNTVAAGSPDGSEINVSISAGYDFKFGALTVGPVASYQYTNMQLDGFTETGLFAPLTIASKSTDSQRTQLGVRATYDAHVGRVLIRPEMRLAWQHEFGSAGYALTSNFATIGGNAFTVAGTTVGRDSLLASAGFIVMWNDRFGTYVYYDGQFGGSNLESHNVSGGFRLQF